MKIHFNPKDFLRQFKIAASVASAKDVKPILCNVKIVADKHNGVLLMATDTDVGIRIRVDADVSKNGETLVPPKQFKQILESTKERLTLESTKTGIVITGEYNENEHWELDTQPADEFPDVADFSETAYHEIPAKELTKMIQRTMFATDKENVRFALSGVCFENNDHRITAVATDGHRLVVQNADGLCIGDHSFGWTTSDGVNGREHFPIVSVKALKLLTKILKDKFVHGTDEIKMAFTGSEQKSRVLFHCNGVTFFSRLLDGKFPNWQSIIPETDERLHANVRCETLRTALDRMVTTKKEPGVLFVFRHGSLTLESRAKESGQSKVKILVAFNDTAEFILDVNFMRDYLRLLDAETAINIYMTVDHSPVLFETNGSNYRYIVMPMSRGDAKPAADADVETVEPEADTGIKVVGQESTMEEQMKEIDDFPCPDDDTDLQTRFFQLQMENDQLQAKAEHYKILLDRAMRVIERMKNDQRVCV